MGRLRRVSVLFLFHYYCVHKIPEVENYFKSKNVMPVPPLSNARSRKHHHH